MEPQISGPRYLDDLLHTRKWRQTWTQNNIWAWTWIKKLGQQQPFLGPEAWPIPGAQESEAAGSRGWEQRRDLLGRHWRHARRFWYKTNDYMGKSCRNDMKSWGYHQQYDQCVHIYIYIYREIIYILYIYTSICNIDLGLTLVPF